LRWASSNILGLFMKFRDVLDLALFVNGGLGVDPHVKDIAA
jgi:hypothetical protein